MSTTIGVPTWNTGITELAPGVYAYVQSKGSWGWSNAGIIVGDEHVVVVDSLFSVVLTQNLLNEIRRITDKPVRYLLITHHHGDHIFGNHLFPDAAIVCHKRCAEETMKLISRMTDPTAYSAIFPEFDFQGAKITPPHITFDRELVIQQGEREIRVIHYQTAHTVGDSIVYLPKEGVVFGGDLLFLYSTPLALEGHFGGWRQALTEMAGLGAKSYVPGHGPICGKEGVLECRAYLDLIYPQARKAFDQGVPLEQAGRNIELGRFKAWANAERIIANTDRLYREFRGEDPLSEIDTQGLLATMNEMVASGW